MNLRILVKRPFVLTKAGGLLGFNEMEWENFVEMNSGANGQRRNFLLKSWAGFQPNCVMVNAC